MDVSFLFRTILRTGQLRRAERWSRSQLEAHQNSGLRRLRDHVYAKSPFYRRFHQGLEDRPLSDLPILTKTILMDEFDQVVTDRRIRRIDVEAHLSGIDPGAKFLNRYVVNASGGSTGQRGVFVSDSRECVTLLASFLRPSAWVGLRPTPLRRQRSASAASSLPWHISNSVFTMLGQVFVRRLQLDVRSSLSQVVDQLQAFDPEWLGGYPSFARTLAQEQLEGRLRIAPKGIIVTGEVLTTETRQFIESVWGKILFNVYATTETAVLAAECSQHTGLHLLEDLTITEVVDGRGAPVPDGEYGEKVLVTVLGRRTQPLIRYEISDMIRIQAEAQCRCGRPFRLVESIQGRVEEIVYLPSITGGHTAIHPLVFDRVLDTVPAKAWQVVQERDSLNVIIAGLRPGFLDASIVESLRGHLAEQGAVAPGIRVTLVHEIPRSASGKAPLIRSNINVGPTRLL